jgi:hypothetical protein
MIDSRDTSSTEEQPKKMKSDSTQEQASKKTTPKETEESASAVDGISQQLLLKNKKSPGPVRHLRSTG